MNGHSDNDMDLHLNLESLDTNPAKSQFEMSDESSEWEDDPIIMHMGAKKNKLPDEFSLNLADVIESSDTEKEPGGLLPYEEGIDVDSEEEKEIMKEIKDEIQKQIRGEMKSELDVYQAKMAALDTVKSQDPNNEEEDNNMDPKLKEAILKMRKLDRILSKKIKREREVKKDRLILERRMKSELEGLNQQNSDAKLNTEKFLALTLPPSHNEGIKMSDLPDEPLFPTQLNEQDYPEMKLDGAKSKGKSSRSGTNSAMSSDRDSKTASDSTSVNGSQKGSKKHKKKKDFIKRNKELAADAENPIPMTQEEKDRVDSLLANLDELPEITENEDDEDFQIPRFQLAVHTGEGFVPDVDEQKTLRSIESRLKQIMPPEDYESVMYTPSTPQSYKLFTPVSIKSNIDIEHFGEKALLEYKDQRELRDRLNSVDEELSKLQHKEEDELSDVCSTGVLSQSKLDDLLDQCARSLSRSSPADFSSRLSDAYSESTLCNSTDTTPRTPKSSREVLMENPPKLSENVLQKLLADAQTAFPSRLSTVREEYEDDDVEKTYVGDVSARSDRWISISDVHDEKDKELSSEISAVLSEDAESARSVRWKRIQDLLMNIDQEETEENENENSQTEHPNTVRSTYEPSQENDQSWDFSHRPIEDTNGIDLDADQQWEPNVNYSNENLNPVMSLNGPYIQRKTGNVLKTKNISVDRSDSVLSDGQDSKTPFLPEINRSGSLVSQDFSRVSSAQSGRSSASSVWTNNTKHQDSIELMSIDGECLTPKPPDTERPSSSKSRTVTPLNR